MACDEPYQPAIIDPSDPAAKQILHPDWQLVEQHLGVAIPNDLKAFYTDSEKVLQEEFEVPIRKSIDGSTRFKVHVQIFCPIDKSSLDPLGGPEGFLRFASDGAGGYYQFKPGSNPCEVYYFFIQDQAIFPTGLTLQEFLLAPRLEPSWGED